MIAQIPEVATLASDQDLRPRARALSWMASLSLASGQIRAAEGYIKLSAGKKKHALVRPR